MWPSPGRAGARAKIGAVTVSTRPHEELVEELAALPESERRAVIRAAQERAAQRARAVASKATLDGLIGVVHLGGDAVEDCRRVWGS